MSKFSRSRIQVCVRHGKESLKVIANMSNSLFLTALLKVEMPSTTAIYLDESSHWKWQPLQRQLPPKSQVHSQPLHHL